MGESLHLMADRGVGASMRLRLAMSITAVLAVSMLVWSAIVHAASLDPQALAASLQSDPVQSIGVPPSSFSFLSNSQINSLRAEIGRLDPGRIWILVVSPRSQSDLGNLADPVYGDLPGGTLIGVAEDPQDPNTTHFWVASTWQSSDAAQNQLNNVINAYHKGQGSLYDDLRLNIQSFARADAAAGHPSLNSAGNSGASGGTSSSGGGGSGGLIVGVVVGAIVLLVIALFVGRYIRGAMRASHWRREENADAHAKAEADFSTLGDQIGALDIDSSMADADPAGKDEYAKALDCYEEAERRMKQSGDEYQFDHGVDAIRRGLEHIENAKRLFNTAPAGHHTPVTDAPGSSATGPHQS
jgi:hypothetical protein